MNELIIIALLTVLLTILLAALVLYRTFNILIRIHLPETLLAEREERRQKRQLRKERLAERWKRFGGLHSLQEEETLVIDHSYDGIKELDNPTPAWFMGLFYATIVFGAVYLSVYHVFGVGLNQEDEYEQEVRIAEKERQAYLSSQANNIDEHSVVLDQRPETLGAGKALFEQSCSPCHGSLGEGGIGPNLTDPYWLHGGGIKDVFRTIKKGVPDKGMIAWEQQLTPAQIAQVSNYIASLAGSDPANAKAPQGELLEMVEEAIDDAVHEEVLEHNP